MEVAARISRMKLQQFSRHVDVAVRARGFTLIEVMVVVAIVGVLAMVAYPSFMAQVLASRRADGISTLAQIQQAQERWRANCPCYAGSLTASNAGCPAVDCANTRGLGLTLPSTRYNFAMPVAPVASAPNTYTITATGVGSQANDRAAGASCATLSVVVTNGVSANAPAACWKR